MSVGEMSVGEMSVGEVSVGEMSVGEMSGYRTGNTFSFLTSPISGSLSPAWYEQDFQDPWKSSFKFKLQYFISRSCFSLYLTGSQCDSSITCRVVKKNQKYLILFI